MSENDLTREELFALVWEKPTTTVAKDLGISDVALGKMCQKMQVPKPPRGYWTRVKSGLTPRQPPLQAWSEEIAKQLRKKRPSGNVVWLTGLQRIFLQHALDDLQKAGTDISGCDLRKDRLHYRSPDLISQLLIKLQHSYQHWLDQNSSITTPDGALTSLRSLVGKLQPNASDQILLFNEKSVYNSSHSAGPVLLIRASCEFIQRLVQLHRLVRDNGLEYASVDLYRLEYAWSIRAIHTRNQYANNRMELCVSSTEIWIRQASEGSGTHWVFETQRLQVSDICAPELVISEPPWLPAMLTGSQVKPFFERLKALIDAQTQFEVIIHSGYDLEQIIPDEKLALFDRLWFSSREDGPFTRARNAWRTIEKDIDRWEQWIESETVILCENVLGISIGDIVLAETGGKNVRIKVKGMTVYESDRGVVFNVWGMRFRKDGILGKRSESFYIEVGKIQ